MRIWRFGLHNKAPKLRGWCGFIFRWTDVTEIGESFVFTLSRPAKRQPCVYVPLSRLCFCFFYRSGGTLSMSHSGVDARNKTDISGKYALPATVCLVMSLIWLIISVCSQPAYLWHEKMSLKRDDSTPVCIIFGVFRWGFSVQLSFQFHLASFPLLMSLRSLSHWKSASIWTTRNHIDNNNKPLLVCSVVLFFHLA